MMAATVDPVSQTQSCTIPRLYTTLPPINDTLKTETSTLQSTTIQDCLPYLSGIDQALASLGLNEHGLPHLLRKRHAGLLTKLLNGPLPAAFKAADPSRPWFFYWILSALDILGEDVEGYRTRLVETVRIMQGGVVNGLTPVHQGDGVADDDGGERMFNEGGFAGGFGMLSHLATTYATVLALAVVGGEEAYDVVDRRGMWRWLCRLKQPDGGFRMAVGGEKDVRGAYCASVIISLLNIPQELTPDSPARAGGHTHLFDGLAGWIGRCQTYEGGISATPGPEAHGAYAFCALGCLSIVESPLCFPKYLDMPKLIAWLSSRQDSPATGFSGRTNKLVDGCYSHWVGGCWPLIEASMTGPISAESSSSPAGRPSAATSTTSDPPDTTLFSRNGLIRYILTCCQDLSKRGGLRDKPTTTPDAYHTCYVLAGLSSAQHKWNLQALRTAPQDADEWIVTSLEGDEQIFSEEDRVNPVHPVYVIRPEKTNAIRKYFQNKAGFS